MRWGQVEEDGRMAVRAVDRRVCIGGDATARSLTGKIESEGGNGEEQRRGKGDAYPVKVHL